jgi:hypothetical protein
MVLGVNKIRKYCFLIVFASILILPAQAVQKSISDPNIQLTLNYPDVVERGKSFVLASIVKATADQVSNITITVSSPELQIPQNSFHLDKLPRDSTFGNNFDIKVNEAVPDGTFVANLRIEYLIKGLFDSQPVKHAITQTTEFNAKSRPYLNLDIQSPSEAFAGEPFSIKGTIKNQGANAHYITLGVSSAEVQLAGKTSILLTNLDAGSLTDFEFVVQTQKEIGDPIHSTVHVNGSYSDENGKTYPLDQSLSIFVRHRGLFEVGDASGIWIGQFFIAPVVGIGTIVSSVIGFLIFLWQYRNRKRKRRTRKSP